MRNLPSPEVNYPLEDIRVVPEGQYIRATEPVALPPPEPSYEAKKLVESLKSAGSSQVITSTRKLISTLAKPAATIQNASATAAARALASQPREIVKATRPAPVEIPSTKVVATARTLAANPAITLFKNRLASD
ncbi:MAG: hypothetical protein PHD82_16530, partial [Candidatus Riflebacteria bacterium]|nr:hypothetical protein [Candidatus Riflebacteria bacterium]